VKQEVNQYIKFQLLLHRKRTALPFCRPTDLMLFMDITAIYCENVLFYQHIIHTETYFAVCCR